MVRVMRATKTRGLGHWEIEENVGKIIELFIKYKLIVEISETLLCRTNGE